jgi:hypothetical protein
MVVQERIGVSSSKGTNLTHESCVLIASSKSSHLKSKSPFPNTVTSGVRVSTYDFGDLQAQSSIL